MKRDEAEDDDGELGRAARRARTEPDGRLAAAVEIAIDTDDDVDAAETDGATDADLAADEADAERHEDDGRVVPQEALIRRRIRRTKEPLGSTRISTGASGGSEAKALRAAAGTGTAGGRTRPRAAARAGTRESRHGGAVRVRRLRRQTSASAVERVPALAHILMDAEQVLRTCAKTLLLAAGRRRWRRIGVRGRKVGNAGDGAAAGHGAGRRRRRRRG